MNEVSTVGIDLAKSVFQVHGSGPDGSVIFRKKLRRDQVLAFFAQLPSCLVAMEACASAHYWAREIAALGHNTRLIPPAYVKPFVKRQKNDMADAEAICEAAQRPTMRFVQGKSAQAQASAVVFRTRDLPRNDAWKRAIGTRPVAARLALLPEEKPRWDRIGVSAGSQLAVLLFLLAIPLLYPDSMKTGLSYMTHEVVTPLTMVPVAPPPPPPPKIKAKTPPPPVAQPEPVKLNPKQPHVFITPKVLQPKRQLVEAKAPEMTPVFEAAKIDTKIADPKRPRDEVKVNNLGSTGSAMPATVKAPVEKVQTGGFGDTTGLKGNPVPGKAVNVNGFGNPALPGGPGHGNGTGGSKGIAGTIASTGFGNGTAVPPPGGGKKGTVQSTGFADQTVVEAPKKKAASSDSPTTPVDILDKPRPEYTAEGRNLKIEGDVVLDVVFLASGTVQVNNVVGGLGHGLDEAAMRAAKQIKFKAAKRDGQPVDFPARVRITFQLAY